MTARRTHHASLFRSARTHTQPRLTMLCRRLSSVNCLSLLSFSRLASSSGLHSLPPPPRLARRRERRWRCRPQTEHATRLHPASLPAAYLSTQRQDRSQKKKKEKYQIAIDQHKKSHHVDTCWVGENKILRTELPFFSSGRWFSDSHPSFFVVLFHPAPDFSRVRVCESMAGLSGRGMCEGR